MAKTKQPAKRSRLRRALRALGIILLVPVVLVALVVGYLHTGSGKERVRALVEARIAAKMNGGEVKLGRLDYALFGELVLGDVTLVDASGRKAVTLDELRVKPKWRELGGQGPIPLESVRLTGLIVSLVKDDAGSNNFRGLFQPVELKKGVAIDELDVSGVAVQISSPDGTTVAVHDVAVRGSLRAQSAIKTYAIDLPVLAASVDVEKPAAGLTVSVKNLQTGLRTAIEAGKGTVTLLPLSTEIGLKVAPRGIDRTIPVKLAGLSATLGDGQVGADLDDLALGLLTLSAVEIRAPMTEGKLAGVPASEVVGLRVVHDELNALLGKELLLRDVDVDAHLGGTPEAPTLKAHVAAGDATIDVDGSVQGAASERPTFQLKTTIKDVDTKELLGSAITAPPVTLESLEIEADGAGRDLASLDANVRVNGKAARVRGVEIDSVTADASVQKGEVALRSLDVHAVDQHVALSGTVSPTSKEVDMTLHLDGDVDAALARLGPVGLVLATKIPKGVLTLPKDDLAVHLRGRMDGDLEIDAKATRLRALGATLGIEARAKVKRGDKEKGDKPVIVKELDAHVSLSGLLLSTVLGLRGKRLPKGFDASLDLRIDASGTPEDPKAAVVLSGRTVRRPTGEAGAPSAELPLLRFGLRADVTKTLAVLNLDVANARDKTDVVLTGSAKLPLALDGEKKGLAPGGRIKIELDVPRRTISSLAAFTPLVPIPPMSPLLAVAPILEKPNGAIALHATFDGTAADPRGTIDLDLETAHILGEASKQRLHVSAKLDKDPGAGTKAATLVTLALDDRREPAVKLDADARFPVSPLLGGAARMTYDAHLAVGPLALEDLPNVPRLARLRALGGSLGVDLRAKGSRQDLDAKLAVTASQIAPGGKGPFDVALEVSVLPDKTTLAADAKLDGSSLVKLGGDVGLGGRGLFARLRDKGFEPTLDLALEVPERPLSTLAKLRPALDKAPGTLGGKITVTGKPSDPRAAGSISLLDVEMADGSRRGAALHLALDESKAGVSVALGATGSTPSAPSLGRIDVQTDRASLFGYREGDPVAVDATFSAKHAPLAALVPAFVAKEARGAFGGSLDWDMKARVVLEKEDTGPALQDAELTGKLDIVDGRLVIPGTKRKLDGVRLSVTAERGRIRLAGLEAHEHDKEVADRSLKVSGEVVLDQLKPTKLDLQLGASKWLLFGTKAIGLPDAPRGSLDLEARASMVLDRPVKTAAVDVKKLDVSIPDRFEKAHQPEDVHVGDLFFVGQGPAIGKLPVPEKKPEPAPKSLDAAPPAPESGLDVEIRIAKGARLLQSPIELHPSGTISLKVRPEGRTVRGQLDMGGGELSLGGKMHPLTRGSLTFDDKRPTGWIDLWFARELPPWALRNISNASGGKVVEIHMFGPLADRRTVLAGAGPGALFDLLSLHNTGRERTVTDADLPDSDTVEFPQPQGLLTLSFLSVNLPHLLFLDRVAAYSDKLDSPKTYGQLDRYEGDRYFAEGRGRIRAARRPPDVGKSEAEIEALYLFENTPQLLFGVGGAAGSRGGGGPGVVLEWSSDR